MYSNKNYEHENVYQLFYFYYLHKTQFISYQHCCSQIKLLIKLSDEQMNWDKIVFVFSLNFPNNFSQPLKLFLRPCDPNKMDLHIENKIIIL